MERIEQIKTFLNDTPEDTFLNYALAIEYVAMAKDSEARTIFEKLLLEKPDYFATYYHLGKLYERQEENQLAEETYEKGLAVTQRLGDKHAHGELRGAYEELTF
jgi:Tfp pilus assembly protein PilF